MSFTPPPFASFHPANRIPRLSRTHQWHLEMHRDSTIIVVGRPRSPLNGDHYRLDVPKKQIARPERRPGHQRRYAPKTRSGCITCKYVSRALLLLFDTHEFISKSRGLVSKRTVKTQDFLKARRLVALVQAWTKCSLIVGAIKDLRAKLMKPCCFSCRLPRLCDRLSNLLASMVLTHPRAMLTSIPIY